MFIRNDKFIRLFMRPSKMTLRDYQSNALKKTAIPAIELILGGDISE